MRKKYLLPILFIFINSMLISQTRKIIESTEDHLTIEYSFNNYRVIDTLISGINYTIIRGDNYSVRKPGEPWLPELIITAGVPMNSNPKIKVISVQSENLSNRLIIPYPVENPFVEKINVTEFDKNIYQTNSLFPQNFVKLDNISIMRYAKIASFSISPFQFNPVSRELVYNKKVVVRIDFNEDKNSFPATKISDPFTEDFIKKSVVNPDVAAKWISKTNNVTENSLTDFYWYNQNLDFYKIYVKNENLYRVTYNELATAGVFNSGLIPDSTVMLFNNGYQIAIVITDTNKNQIFDSGDYFEFIGKPPSPGDFTRLNIYNTENVYWLTYRSDTTALRYKTKDAFPHFYQNTLTSSRITQHFEKDTIYERLGHAPDDQRDYWYWGKASAHNYSPIEGFEFRYESDTDIQSDSTSYTVRLDMHGITDPASTYPDHKAQIYFNDQKIADHYWDGQSKTLFEKKLYVSSDSIHVYAGNYIKVFVRGDTAASVNSDEIRINWCEIDYWRHNRANNNIVKLTSGPVSGFIRFWTWKWTTDSIVVFVPQRNEILTNLYKFNDTAGTVTFVDQVNNFTEYYCYGLGKFSTVDSIVKHSPTTLRSLTNGSDYIIITHEKFKPVAEELKNFRQGEFPDPSIPNPRIKIVYVNEIYDEFSYGLLDPGALRKFVQFAFESWTAPAPSYVVILGDMSYDYRKVLYNSRPNFVPSMTVHAATYGQAVSDNMIVSVAGVDWVPDLCIGRLSIERNEEGWILLDKIKNYPLDNSKEWKQNVLLIASGLNKDDENYFRFNDASMELDKNYLVNNGMNGTKIFRYPNIPEYEPFQGETAEIRKGFNDGAIIANYYGHGGGYQWDLVFINEDIYLLENGGRLPFVSSVTCYTAHFDNQDVFGEQFIKVPNKGCIGFFGSSGLTIWGIGDYINMLLFDQVFNKQQNIIGKSILNAKSQVAGFSYYYLTQIALLTYFGDPILNLDVPYKPDFTLKSNDITINKTNILTKDTTVITSILKNNGTVFTNDTITVEILAVSSDTSYLVDTKRITSFGERDTIKSVWIPEKSGLYEITVKINLVDSINEMDYSDNTASTSFVVYDLSEPNIIRPVNGFSTNNNKIDFLFSDIGYYINLSTKYYIQIDTTKNISENSVFILSPSISPVEGIVNWTSPELPKGEYFWRTRIYDGEKFGIWSDVMSFSINESPKNGYYALGNILKMFDKYNINYSDSSKSLDLNLALLPPRPSNKTFLDTIKCPDPVVDTLSMTAITTDGTFLYVGGIAYYSYNPNNPNGISKIYKIGTGNNGTIKGEYAGEVPNFNDQILNSIFYHGDGYLYVPTGRPDSIKQIDRYTGDINLLYIPEGLLRWEDSRSLPGTYYLASDGRYVYNLTLGDTNGLHLYTVRTFDPANEWKTTGPDKVLFGTSYFYDFSGFFVADNYIYPFEKNHSGYMRRIKLSDGAFEEEWITLTPYYHLFSWCYDWAFDQIYATQFKGQNQTPDPYIFKFTGKYHDSFGKISSNSVGPAVKWKNINYNMLTAGSNAVYYAQLFGLNNETKNWDTLNTNLAANVDLDTLDAANYPYLKMEFNITDSTLGASIPIKLKSINMDYTSLPELILTKNNFNFAPDTLLQGFETEMELKIKNIGLSDASNVSLGFFLNGADTTFYQQAINVPKDSTQTVKYTINTSALLPATTQKIQSRVLSQGSEFYTYNNLVEKSFFVQRDSINPLFNVTIDGKEIINGDIISSNPEVMITLQDEGPLPIDTSYFTIVHNNIPLGFKKDKMAFDYTPYPNSNARVTWKPTLKEGKHTLEILAKDASGNFFDTTSARLIFYVYNNFDVVNLFNYPNPFKNDTHFTFELRGDNKDLEEFNLKVFTVAGRLIRNLKIPVSSVQSGFNKFAWDGRDEDGDEISNGVYLYKAIIKYKGNTKTIIQKLAKVK